MRLKPGTQPISIPLRRRSPKEREIEKKEMMRLLKLGVLEPSTSPWAAANVFVPKKDGGTRVTSDFRRLNSVTVTDAYPMEDIRSVLDWLGSKKIFFVFDLKDGIFQISLHKESREFTAIRTAIGLLQQTTAKYEKFPRYFPASCRCYFW